MARGKRRALGLWDWARGWHWEDRGGWVRVRNHCGCEIRDLRASHRATTRVPATT